MPGRFKAIMRCNRGACAARASRLQRSDKPRAFFAHVWQGWAGWHSWAVYTRGSPLLNEAGPCAGNPAAAVQAGPRSAWVA